MHEHLFIFGSGLAMANRSNRIAGLTSLKGTLLTPNAIIAAGLDALNLGFAIFDRNLKLVANNKAFAELRGYPATLCKPGTDIIEFYRFNAERGDYGPGDAEAQAISRMERVRERQPHQIEYELASGQILNIRYAPVSSRRACAFLF
jgi:PAS domain-containing protein